MSTVQDEFLRRYATSPIHVPRLERLITAYGGAVPAEEFIRNYLAWDHASGDAEAARIVAEILPLLVDGEGAIVRLTDEAIHGAIDWLSNRGAVPLTERAFLLHSILQEAVQTTGQGE